MTSDDSDASLIEGLGRHAVALTRAADELLAMSAGKRFVLIGEASHGTEDFYRFRADLTRRLIESHGFQAVAIEADWPDACRVNGYVQGDERIASAEGALDDFQRFPTWMWRNEAMRDFVAWLHDHNRTRDRKAGVYGLDLYSLNRSVAEVIAYLEKVDPEAAARARARYGCFAPFDNDPQYYGFATGRGRQPDCERDILAQLTELRQSSFDLTLRGSADAFFSAEQNARLVATAEHYYRAMFKGRPDSWNIRDTHMADTLDELAEHLSEQHGEPARIVVWAHNSHIGDARATGQGESGQVNIGQLTRERHPHETLLIGFSTYEGTVRAADDWDEPDRVKTVRPALDGSYEALLHEIGGDFLLNLRDRTEVRETLAAPRLSRFIGVIYRPDTERQSHYVRVRLPDVYDAVVHIDRSQAVKPLVSPVGRVKGRDVDETYPTGL